VVNLRNNYLDLSGYSINMQCIGILRDRGVKVYY